MPAQSHPSVCLFVRRLKGKWLELSTPNLVQMYSIEVDRHAVTQRSKGQGHTITQTAMFAQLLVTMAGIPFTYTPLCYLWPLLAWD